jgi:hypothetical protein
VGFAAGAWWSFHHRKDHVLFPVLLGITFVFVLDAAVLGVVVWAARAARVRDGLRESVGQRIPVVRWPSWIFWQPFVSVRVVWESPVAECELANVGSEVREQVMFRRRLMDSSVRRRISVEDWMGVFRWDLLVEDCVAVHIGPSRAVPVGESYRIHHENGHGEDGEGSADGDFLDFRGYREGDSESRILWKLFSRSGELYVRKAEKTGSALVGLFLACSEKDDAAASMAWYATDLESPRSQELFGENWVLGTSFESRDAPMALASSADWQASRQIILESGGGHPTRSPGELALRIEAFRGAAGPGVISVVVLLGDEALHPEDRVDGCHYLKVTRRDALLEWEVCP